MILIALSGATVWWLSRPPPAAAWLEVTAPRAYDPDRPYVVRVRIADARFNTAAESIAVAVHLHGLDRYREGLGFLATAGSQPLPPDQAQLDFAFAPISRPEAQFVFLLVFISPTGRWDDRIAASSSELISIRSSPERAGQTENIAMYDRADSSRSRAADSRFVQVALAIGFLLGFTLITITSARGRSGSPVPLRLISLWLLLAAAWELLPVGSAFAEQVRTFANEQHWYPWRHGLQRIVTAGIIAATATILWLMASRVRPRHQSIILCGLTAYSAVAAARFVSLHGVDSLLHQPIAGIPIGQILKLAALLLVFGGAVMPWSTHRDRTPDHDTSPRSGAP